MSDALSCDGKDCSSTSSAPFLGWWHLQNASLVRVFGQRDRLDFCSWECLGAFVFEAAEDVAEMQKRISELK